MSIILKGIDLPSENQTIVVEVFPNGRCAVMKTEKGECYELTTKGKAKAIQIPKDHGRLGDLDYLYDRFKANKCPDENVYRLIKEEPTILGAEGAE